MTASARGRERLRGGLLVLAIAVLWPFAVTDPAAHRTAAQLLALMLIGLSLTVTVGWLRVVSLYQPAAVAVGAGLTAALLSGGQAAPVALAGAAAGGSAVALLSLGIAASDPRRWLPLVSLAVTAVAAVLVDAMVLRVVTRPVVLGVDLAVDRILYLAGLVLVAGACVLVARLRETDVGRRLLAVGTDEVFAGRSGVAAGPTWAEGVALSGALAGVAGWLTALIHYGLPSPLEFAPTTAVAYLAIPVLGGSWSVVGAVVGAGVFLLAARLGLALGWSSLAVPAAVLVLAAVRWRPAGLTGWVASGRHVAALRRILAGQR